jgi:hypothetical protein
LSGLNLNYLTDFAGDYLFDTFAPPSTFIKNSSDPSITILQPIIFMASVIDSLGGITNLTQTVNVTLP